VALALTFILAAVVVASENDEGYAGVSLQRARLGAESFNNLKADYPAVRAYKTGPLVTRLYGTAFGRGSSPTSVAEHFRQTQAGVFGVNPEDLVSGHIDNSELTSQQLMYNRETDSYKFTLIYYSQQRDGVPIFGSELRLLVRNEADFPLVLAVSSLRDMGDFTVDRSLIGEHSVRAEQAGRADEPGLTDFTQQEAVIWAGVDNIAAAPRMAVKFRGYSDFPQAFLFVVDPNTGEILHKEDLIIFEDVVGRVRGMATPGPKAMQCTDEILTPFPYAYVSIVGGNSAYADKRSDFTISNPGSSPVTVISPVGGQYFWVYNYTGTDVVETLIVIPPGPANFLHNALNTSEAVRAQMNGYVNANEVRDWTLVYNPTYPVIYNQTDFTVNVNRVDGYCPGNAWYSGSSINFCSAGDGYANTSFASVSQHEYGHHLVESGGSGQGQYGEGMADCAAMLIADDPGLGYGFYYDQCNTPLRNADNTMQYPCDGEIHYCGQLLSGCVWSTRNELTITEPVGYLDTLSNLTVNSILLHTGTQITPQITIDFLTLDDDDANLDNGTPHYYEIDAGFGAHNMPAPELAPLMFEYPNGVPTMLPPSEPTIFQVVVSGQSGGTPVPGTGKLHYSIDGGSATEIDMTETSPNHYDATLPGLDCYSTVTFYVSAEAEGMGTFYDPDPSNPFWAIAATDMTVVFEDDFETDKGWSVSGDAYDGQWDRGVPVGGGDRGDPPTDFDGSGKCYLTDNVDGDSDVDGGTTILTSPVFDLSAGNAQIRYARWYSNNFGNDPYNDVFEIFISNDNGSNWALVETVGPVQQASGGWYEYTFWAGDIVTLTSQVRLRFDASDLSAGSVIEAAIDAVTITTYDCDTSSLQIITETLPDWTVGSPYSQQLQAIGGTGTLTWSDKHGDLIGTGLTLSASGLLSGTPNSTGQISFTAEVTDEVFQTDEKVFSFFINPVLAIITDSLPDWTVGLSYSQQLQATGGTGTRTWSDKYNDLAGTGLSLSTTGLVSGVPNSAGTISFTAYVSDEGGDDEEKLFTFTINPAMTITTGSLPAGTEGELYSQQLEASGGTGAKIWSDKNNNLQGTGLSLAADGLLSGTPVDTGTISFTALVEDAVGSADEKPFSFVIGPSYICGDVDGNGVGPNVADLTYLVDYIFFGGSPPPVAEAANVDGEGGINVADVTYLVEYLFFDGPELNCN